MVIGDHRSTRDAPRNGSVFFWRSSVRSDHRRSGHRSWSVRSSSVRSVGHRSSSVRSVGHHRSSVDGSSVRSVGGWAVGGWADDARGKSGRTTGRPRPPFFYLSIYIAPHEIFWPFWLKNKVLTSDNKAVRNSGMTLNYL